MGVDYTVFNSDFPLGLVLMESGIKLLVVVVAFVMAALIFLGDIFMGLNCVRFTTLRADDYQCNGGSRHRNTGIFPSA